MILQELLAQIASAFKHAARHTREVLLRLVHRRFAWHPALSPAGSADDIPLPTMIPGELRGRHIPKKVRVWLLAGLVLILAVHEAHTSALQAWLFSHWASRLTYKLKPGPSLRITFPVSGPFDQRLGYTRIPEFERRLKIDGYRVTAQAQIGVLKKCLLRVCRARIGTFQIRRAEISELGHVAHPAIRTVDPQIGTPQCRFVCAPMPFSSRTAPRA